MSMTVEHSLTAACTPEQVWAAFANLEQWPAWNRVVGEARWLEGTPWQVGSRFQLQLVSPRELSLEPVIIEAEPPHRVTWDGSGSLLSGENRFRFEPNSNGATRLTVTGEFSGFGTLFWGEQLKSFVAQMFAEWLNALKTEAEKVAAQSKA